MWLDGIITEPKKRGRNGKRKRRKNTSITVSARVKERKAERRRRVGLGVMLLVLVVGFGWVIQVSLAAAGRYFFTENDRYLIREWDLRSNGRLLTPAHIKEYGQLEDGDNLFAIDLSEVRRRLEEVAVVERVEVARQLPDRLMVRVDERLAVAQLAGRGRYRLAVDRHGHVLGPGSLRPNLPTMNGLDQPGIRPGIRITDPQFADALRFLDLCDRPHISPYVQPDQLFIQNEEALEVRLRQGTFVRLARAHLEVRLAELVAIMEEARGQQRQPRIITMTGEPTIPPVVQF